ESSGCGDRGDEGDGPRHHHADHEVIEGAGREVVGVEDHEFELLGAAPCCGAVSVPKGSSLARAIREPPAGSATAPPGAGRIHGRARSPLRDRNRSRSIFRVTQPSSLAPDRSPRASATAAFVLLLLAAGASTTARAAP